MAYEDLERFGIKSVLVPGLGRMDLPLDPVTKWIFQNTKPDPFWSAAHKWPHDAMGMVFLARAVLRVGEAMFGDQWKGYEPTTPDPPPFGKDAAQRTAAINLLAPGRIRYEAVKSAIVAGFLAESGLPFVLRNNNTGAFSDPLPQHWWNTELIEPRFARCEINPREPISRAFAGRGFLPIFVPSENLVPFIALVSKSQDVGPEPKNTAEDAKKLERYLTEIMERSPNKRTHTKKRDIAPWMRENTPSISPTSRPYNEIRKSVLDKAPQETRDAWGKKGG